MSSWTIRWNYNAASYQPGETAYVSFWLDNGGQSGLYLSDLRLNFEFGTYNLQSVSGQVAPLATKFLGNVSLQLPTHVVGRQVFSWTYRMHESVGNTWTDLGSYSTDRQYFISVYPKPLYKVFVSRGLHIEDRAVGDPIVEMIKEWAFETVTVGVERQVPENQVPYVVREEIKAADAVVVIATPRFLDALTGLWRTLEWAHGETGIAFGVDKPLLLLTDRRVTLGGLPSYLLTSSLQTPSLEFDLYNPDDLRRRVGVLMPSFRSWIETQRRQEFFASLGRLVVGGLAVMGVATLLAGASGSQGGSSKK